MKLLTYVNWFRFLGVIVAAVSMSSRASGGIIVVSSGSFLRTAGTYQYVSGSAVPIFVDNIQTPYSPPPNLSVSYFNSSESQGHAAISSSAANTVCR